MNFFFQYPGDEQPSWYHAPRRLGFSARESASRDGDDQSDVLSRRETRRLSFPENLRVSYLLESLKPSELIN